MANNFATATQQPSPTLRPRKHSVYNTHWSTYLCYIPDSFYCVNSSRQSQFIWFSVFITAEPAALNVKFLPAQFVLRGMSRAPECAQIKMKFLAGEQSFGLCVRILRKFTGVTTMQKILENEQFSKIGISKNENSVFFHKEWQLVDEFWQNVGHSTSVGDDKNAKTHWQWKKTEFLFVEVPIFGNWPEKENLEPVVLLSRLLRNESKEVWAKPENLWELPPNTHTPQIPDPGACPSFWQEN